MRNWLHLVVLTALLVGFSPPSAWAQATGSPAPVSAPSPGPSSGPQKKGADAPEPLKVNPYGPTYTSPATLTNVGVPEYEVFWYSSSNAPGFKSLVQTPLLVKYTFANQWQASVGTQGYVQQRLDPQGPTARVLGDPTFALKYNYMPPRKGASSQSLQLGYQVPVSPMALGVSTGRPDPSLTWFYSRDLSEQVSFDANLILTLISVAPGPWHLQFSQGFDFNVALSDRVTYSCELHHIGSAGAAIPEIYSNQHVLEYSVAPSCMLAGGVDIGLNRTAPRLTYMLGVIFLIDNRHR